MTADLADPAVFAAGGQHEAWRELRQHSPVHRHPSGFWSVTGYADVERVLRDHAAFTSERGTLLNLLGKPDPASGRQLAATDPPAHDRMRLPLQRVMGSRAAGASTRRIQLAVRELLAPGADGDAFDLAVAMRGLPLALIGSLLDLPTGDWPRLVQLVMAASAEEDPEFQLADGPAATLARAHRELFAYFLELVRARGRAPGDDLVSLMLTVMDPAETVSNCYSLLLGASVTLPNVPTAAVLATAGTPAWRRFADDPDALASGVEEALRWASPASHFMRHATGPVTLSGVAIPAGDPVVAWIGAANRDPAIFVDPDVFDPVRSPNRHLAFGGGHHYCIGSHHARLALRLLFTELFAMFDEVDVVGEPVRVRSTFLSGFTRLAVAGRPRRR
ncbi:cytochrome P450 [Allocatelliglobosispora scoriae]|uniref:Cytochrome P450 n=1 Tax=Allocatelliglobosispora scoriae TaxID=643052 RepID=A0A841C0Y1_9ACTN|nr:cytochrome P450 [Allocatelliglobosispora scoriae]MBB5872712.1 cytochrome P450 [Allocatelliglobosispora scoriae]